MNYQTDIIDILDKALVEKTFDLEIVTKIKQLKDEHVTALERIKELEKERASYINIQSDLNRDLQQQKEALLVWRSKEKAIEEAEKGAEKLKYELQFQKDRGNEIKEMFMHVFRNPTIMRSKMTNVPVSQNGYISNQSGSENETEHIN